MLYGIFEIFKDWAINKKYIAEEDYSGIFR